MLASHKRDLFHVDLQAALEFTEWGSRGVTLPGSARRWCCAPLARNTEQAFEVCMSWSLTSSVPHPRFISICVEREEKRDPKVGSTLQLMNSPKEQCRWSPEISFSTPNHCSASLDFWVFSCVKQMKQPWAQCHRLEGLQASLFICWLFFGLQWSGEVGWKFYLAFCWYAKLSSFCRKKTQSKQLLVEPSGKLWKQLCSWF